MTISNTDWTALQQAEDMAYFKADICLYSPESYTLEEKHDMCNEMISTSKAVLDAMREDFQSYPIEIRTKLLDMLCLAGACERKKHGAQGSQLRNRLQEGALYGLYCHPRS